MNWRLVHKTVIDDLYSNAKHFSQSSYSEKTLKIARVQNVLDFLTSTLKTEIPELYVPLFQQLRYQAQAFLDEMKKGLRNTSNPPESPLKKYHKTQSVSALPVLKNPSEPKFCWADVVGLIEAKRALQEAVTLPLLYPQFFVGNVKPWTTILLYGPPGTGKTFLAQVCAAECKSAFYPISASDILSKYFGESEKKLRELFRDAENNSPSLIFIDEIDALGSTRNSDSDSMNRLKAEMLVQLQGMTTRSAQVLVLAATNLPWNLDNALRRRFERRIYIPLPGFEDRKEILKRKLEGLDSDITDFDYKEVARMTDGFSGSDLEVIAKEAAFEPLRLATGAKKFRKVGKGKQQKFFPLTKPSKSSSVIEMGLSQVPDGKLRLPEVTRQDLMKAAFSVKPTVSRNDLIMYESWTKEFGMTG